MSKYTHTDSQEKNPHISSLKHGFKILTLGTWHLPEMFARQNKQKLLNI